MTSATKSLRKQLLKQHKAFKDCVNNFTRALNAGVALHHTQTDINELKTEIEARVKQLTATIAAWEGLLADTKRASLNRSWWEIVLAFIPAIRRYTREKYRASINIPPALGHQDIGAIFGQDFDAVDTPQTVLNRLEREISSRQKALSETKDNISALKYVGKLLVAGKKEVTVGEAAKYSLDCEHRYGMFITAMNYWYGRFLSEAQQLLDYPPSKNPRKKEILQRYAMVTPCFVSTMASLPNTVGEVHYWHEDKASREVIDLLIIDEAGQATPEQSAYLFSLAGKALVVGDERQIEPVSTISQDIDKLCLTKANLSVSDEDIKTYNDTKFRSLNGNLMGMALRATPLQMDEKTPGLLLREHFRCQRQIIEYCNQLSYDGKLIPMAKERVTQFPKMGFVDVVSDSKQVLGSRVNEGQVDAVIDWLKRYGQEMVQCYGDKNSTIATEIAIITPFKKMSDMIQSKLHKAGLLFHNNRKITVGTVHSLQGAERNVVLFTTTYGQNDDAQNFIDATYNLLNVVASRSKMHFVVFGNYNVLSANKNGDAVEQLMKIVKPWR